jgi:hypothetical protein
MNSPSNSICTTVSKRPAELKPITGVSLLLPPTRILQHKEGIIEDRNGLLERDAVLALILRGFRLIPAEARASVLRRRGPCAESISAYLQCKYRLPEPPRTTALAPVLARCGCFGCRGSSPTDAPKLREPLRSGKYGGEETGYAQVEIEAFEVQAAASTKDFDRADISGRSSPETWYQLHRQDSSRRASARCVSDYVQGFRSDFTDA